jgi:ATP-dependent helicase/DNAse subunit B
LLFAGTDETLIRRARQYFAEPRIATPPRRPLLAQGGAIRERSTFEVPQPPKQSEKLERISVTRFKSYLACPFRYYLRHIRKLEAIDDAARELDGAAFGILLHGALSAWGCEHDAPRDSTRAEEVFEYLDEQLRLLARQRYGAEERRASIRLQVEQARRRLKLFAVEQTKLMADGWRVLYA